MKIIAKVCLVTLVFLLLVGCGEDSNNPTSNGDPTNNTDDPISGENESYTIRFITNGDTGIPDQTVEEGHRVDMPDNPIKIGYIFIQWHTNDDLDQPFNRTEEITSDMVLYAEWEEISMNDVVITFESDHGNAIAPIVGTPGEDLIRPVNPSDPFYSFVEWQVKGTNTSYTDFTLMPDNNITLVAVWEKNDQYRITFYINQATEYTTLTVTSGAQINLPDDPNFDDYIFTGWYSDQSFNNPFNDSNLMPERHLDVYGKFIPVDDYFYEVIYDTDGGSVIETPLVIVGEQVIEPDEPVKKGYIFEGWYTETTYQNQFNFDYPQTDDITLYAKWTFDDTFTITNLIDPLGETRTIVLGIQEAYDLPQLFHEGYIFDWWYTNSNYRARYNSDSLYFGQALDYELDLYAKWIEAPNVVYVELQTNGGFDARYTEGGGIIKTGIIQANPGDQISVYNPSREGYRFTGWFLDEALTMQYMPASSSITTQTIQIPQSDTTYYAQWVSKTTGEVDDGQGTSNLSLIEKLVELGFTCTDSTCILEESADRNFIFNLNTEILSYVIDVDTINAEGYRYYDRVLSIEPNYDIDYFYKVEDDHGYYYNVELSLEGNHETGSYHVTHFDSNVTDQQTNYDKAIDFIDNIINFYNAIME